MQPGIGSFPMHSFDNSALRRNQKSYGYDTLCHNNISVVERTFYRFGHDLDEAGKVQDV